MDVDLEISNILLKISLCQEIYL